MSRGLLSGLLLAAAVALALRCPQLSRRPMHNDEAVNAIKFRSLWENGDYRFDPNEHHGPTLYYSTLAWAKLTRAPGFADFNEARLRTVTVLFGVGLILLLPLVADGLGRKATVGAGLLTAVSPALVYYNRDYIHETLLVFFTFLALAGAWRYCRGRKIFWAALTGAALGLMQATKETFVLAVAAAVAAFFATLLWDRRTTAPDNTLSRAACFKPILIALGVWCLVVVLFFSSFFTNAGGPLDALRTYQPWLDRAAGHSPHLHPWYFYLAHLAFFQVRNGPVWSEGLILALAVVGFLAAFARPTPTGSNPSFLRFLAFYTLFLTILYSLIPYKTPWCLLGFWHGMILLAGVGAAVLLQKMPTRGWKISAAMVLAAAVVQLAWQAWQAASTFSADRRNPYVYAQSSPDVLTLADELAALAAIAPEGRHVLTKVMAPGGDYWPLPWYLRAFDQVGWWDRLPADPLAPVMIVSTKLDVTPASQETHVSAGLFELRPDNFIELYVQTNLWRAYLDSKTRDRERHQ